jgi:diacylglycerol kinase family enzyme
VTCDSSRADDDAQGAALFAYGMTKHPRLVAWLGLFAASVALVALAALLARDLRALIVVLAAVAVAAGAGWCALTRRGLVRVLAAAVGVLAVVGGAVALVLFDSVDELLVLGLAVVLMRAAARRVTRVPPPEDNRRSMRRAGASHAVLLMNPKSGGGKVERFRLEDEARRRGIEPIVLDRGDDLLALARDAASRADVLGMAGGDGSQALVAQVAMEEGCSFVCVPAGTRNHFALDLGVDRDDVVGALDAFEEGFERRIDLAFVNDRVFVNNVSLGAYAEIVQSDAYRDAKLESMERMLPDLLGPDATPFDLRYTGPDGDERQSAQLILVSNNPYVLDRLVGAGSRPRLDTGALGIVTVEIESAVQAAELVSLDALGQGRRFRGWLEWSAGDFTVASAAPVAAGIDGEASILESPLRFTSAPAALTVRLPPAAAGHWANGDSPTRRNTMRRLFDGASARH